MSWIAVGVVAGAAIGAVGNAYSAHEANEAAKDSMPQVDAAYQKYVNQGVQLDTQTTQEAADFYKYGTITPYEGLPVRPYQSISQSADSPGYYYDHRYKQAVEENEYERIVKEKSRPLEDNYYGSARNEDGETVRRFEWIEADLAPGVSIENGVFAMEAKELDINAGMLDDLEAGGLFDQFAANVIKQQEIDTQLLAEESAIIPERYGAESAQLQGTIEKTPYQTAADIAEAKYTSEYTPYKTEADIAAAQEQTAMIGLRAPVMSEYFSQVMEGVDPKESMDSATAEVMSANDATKASMTRDAMAMGIEPGSAKWNEMMKDDRNIQTGAIADARTAARNKAEDTSFSRLSGAMGVGA